MQIVRGSLCYLVEDLSMFAVGCVFVMLWLCFECTFEKPAVKAKGLKRFKIHSRDSGSFSNSVKEPSNPKTM